MITVEAAVATSTLERNPRRIDWPKGLLDTVQVVRSLAMIQLTQWVLILVGGYLSLSVPSWLIGSRLGNQMGNCLVVLYSLV